MMMRLEKMLKIKIEIRNDVLHYTRLESFKSIIHIDKQNSIFHTEIYWNALLHKETMSCTNKLSMKNAFSRNPRKRKTLSLLYCSFESMSLSVFLCKTTCLSEFLHDVCVQMRLFVRDCLLSVFLLGKLNCGESVSVR